MTSAARSLRTSSASFDAGIIPAIAKLLGAPGVSPELQRKLVDALGGTPEGGQAWRAFPGLSNSLIEPAFGHILKRRESAAAFLELLANKTVPITVLGPAGFTA